jgi:hypothetical protein
VPAGPLGDLGALCVMNGPSHAKNAKGAKDCIEENRRTPVASHSGLRRECHALFYGGAQARFSRRSANALGLAERAHHHLRATFANLERRPTLERRRPSRRHGRTPPAKLTTLPPCPLGDLGALCVISGESCLTRDEHGEGAIFMRGEHEGRVVQPARGANPGRQDPGVGRPSLDSRP